MMTLDEFAAAIRDCHEIVVFTGAGISTESGIPDFRSPGGIWTRYKPITFHEYVSREEARIESWKRRLETHEVHKYAKPNIGHYFVQSLDQRRKLIGLITQNVDGLHTAAGLSDEKIVELHGTNRKVICLACNKRFNPEEVLKRLIGDFASPKCDARGGILKIGDDIVRPGDAAGSHATCSRMDRKGACFHRYGLIAAGSTRCLLSRDRKASRRVAGDYQSRVHAAG